MRTYVIRRVLLIIPTVLIVSMIVFLSVRLIPGDVIDMMMALMGPEATSGLGLDREAIEHMLGLDVPIPIQYGRWMGEIILRGNLGESMRGGPNVTEQLFSRLPVTIELGVLAVIVGLLIALPIGIYSAIRQETLGDYGGRTVGILFLCIPNFWLGTIVMIYPSIWWGWSPPMELVKFVDDPLGNLGMFTIPAVILGASMAGVTMRMTRTTMLEVLRQDYVRTAWSKGLKERVVIIRHSLKNAFIPVITIVGMQLPLLVAGAVIMEQIFGLPGVGRLFLGALIERDYTMVSGINLFIATVIIGINLLVDITYGYLDPRVQDR